MTLHATALNGAWIGQATVIRAATDTPDIIIPMNPVATAPVAQNIALVDNTGTAAATFSMQVAHIHWATQGLPLTGSRFPMGALALVYDAQGQPVVMNAEDYFPNPNNSAVQNTRLVFRRPVAGAWTDVAAPVDFGDAHGVVAPLCVGFPLDQDDSHSYMLLSNLSYTANQWNGTARLPIGSNAGVLPQANDGRLCSSPPDQAFSAAYQPIVSYDASGQLFVQHPLPKRQDWARVA